MRKFIPSLLILFLILTVSCSRHTDRVTNDTTSLAGLKAMSNKESKKATRRRKNNKIREMALKETGLSVGAQSGLAWRAKIIDEQLTKLARRLDTVYDFNSLILEHNVLPPVLLEGRNTLNLAD